MVDVTLYVLVADGEFDQIVERRADMRREKRDLEAMGCVVRVKQFDNWQDAQAYADKIGG